MYSNYNIDALEYYQFTCQWVCVPMPGCRAEGQFFLSKLWVIKIYDEPMPNILFNELNNEGTTKML